MKKGLKFLIAIVFLSLIIVNLYIFVSGMQLSQKISYFENETRKLQKANIDLEKRVYEIGSLDYAATVAAQLDFTQKAEPYFLENLGFALRK